jgi:hypothetical protein
MNLGMGTEWHDYDEKTIGQVVAQNKIGNYALGYNAKDGSFIPEYVGRSDNDLCAELISHMKDNGHYNLFKFKIATSVKEAYERECNNFHDFYYDKNGKKQLENIDHPANPNGLNLKCPRCNHGSLKHL